MTRSLLGPMVIEVLSTNKSCTEPADVVLIRSLCSIEVPIEIVRKLAVAAGFTAEAVPTSCARASGAAAARRSAAPAVKIGLFACIARLPSEPGRRANGNGEIAGAVVRQRGTALRI